jgi:hypothetical protein
VSDDEIRRVPNDHVDEEFEQAWIRRTDEPDVRSVSAQEFSIRHNSPNGGWQVMVAAMEFVRGGETEAELRRGIISALRAIPEVTNVYEEDREVWGVDGNPSGHELVAAAAAVVDQFADRIRIANGNVLETPPPGYPARPPRQQATIEQLADTAVESITDEIRRMRGVQLDSRPEFGGWSDTQVENLSNYFEQLVEDIRVHPRSQRDQIDVKVIFDSVGMAELPPNGAVTVAAVRAASGFNNFARRAERMR